MPIGKLCPQCGIMIVEDSFIEIYSIYMLSLWPTYIMCNATSTNNMARWIISTRKSGVYLFNFFSPYNRSPKVDDFYEERR